MSLSEQNRHRRRSASDYAIEHGGYLADAVSSFLDMIGRVSVFDPDVEQHLREKVSDHLKAMRSGVHEFEKRASRAAVSQQIGEFGWVYFSPDTGTEYAPSHPIESGEVPDATDVRPATAFERHLAGRQEGSAERDGGAGVPVRSLSVQATDKSDRAEGVAELQQPAEPVAYRRRLLSSPEQGWTLMGTGDADFYIRAGRYEVEPLYPLPQQTALVEEG